jgi:transcription termination factor Rho
MSVLDRAALEDSPLADLHAIASELSIDGFRRLRREALIDAILDRAGGGPVAAGPDAADAEPDVPDGDEDDADVDAVASEPARRRRGRRGGRGRGGSRETAADGDDDRDAAPEPPEADAPARADAPAPADEPARHEPELEVMVEGVVELLPNGSGFVRVSPPDPSDDDVYISAAQVKRCELVSGDRVAGPRRAPRRSERFASLVRIDTINDRPASELADGLRYDELPAAFPSERFRLASDDPTLKAIEWLTPIGHGSRVTITGGPRAGKTEALRRLWEALSAQDGAQVFVALAGVRPEEISEWVRVGVDPAAAVSFAASADAQDHAIELVVDQARRIAARGGDAVVLIDTLDGLHPHSARKLIAAARNIVEGGSLTVIATASKPIGGETTVIALDATLTSTGRFPSVDLVASGTIHPELLVGEAGAEAIAQARSEALGA